MARECRPCFGSWTCAPAGSLSYAAVFEDISILSDGMKETERFGYHWGM